MYNADASPDTIAFVALVPIPEGEEIKFTDNGWLAAGSFRTGEGTFTYTAPIGGIPIGTVVTLTLSGPTLATAGDQIIAFQGTSSVLAALNNEGAGVWQSDATSANTSALPTGLVDGTTAVALNEIDNAIYSGSLVGTKEELLSLINNRANWTSDDATVFTWTAGNFTVDSSGATPSVSIGGTLIPFSSISGTPSASQSFTVTGTNLISDINLAAPAGFELSTNNASFSQNTTLTQSGGNATGTVLVRLAATAPEGAVSGNITLTSANATTRTLAVSGSVRPATVAIPHAQDFETNSDPWFTHSVAGNANWARVSSSLGNGSFTNTPANGAMQVNGFGSDVSANDWLLIGPFNFGTSSNPGILFNSLTRFAGNGTVIGELNLKVSTNYSGSGDPSLATWTTLNFTKPSLDLFKTNSGLVPLTGAANQNGVYVAFHYVAGGTTSGTTALWQVDDVTIGNDLTPPPATPTLGPVTLASPLSTTFGSASPAVSFTANGSNLTANITATAQSGFEISTDNTNFSSSVSIAAPGILHVRFASTQPVGTYNNAVAAVLSSANATNVNVTTSASGNTVNGLQSAPAITSATSANATVGSPFSYTITASNNPTSFGAGGLPAGLTVNTTSGLISGTPTTAGNPNSTISATNSSGTGNATLAFAIARGNQTISGVQASASRQVGDPSYSLNATINSGLPISYTSSNTSVATIANGTVTILAAGNTTLTASQAGNANWFAAPNATQNLTVTANTSPIINVTPISLSGFTTTPLAPSANLTVTVNGTNLLGAITATAPAGYEISTDGVTYSSNLTLTPSQAGAPVARAATVIASDTASNYGVPGNHTWGNGANAGTGFQPWSFNVVTNDGGTPPPAFYAGAFIGNPADAGITNMPSPSFGLYANPGGTAATATVSRAFAQSMAVGDSFSFQWATNWDSDVGNKGFNIFAGGNQVVNVNQAGFPGDITLNGQVAIPSSAFGTLPMTWTFTRTTATNLLVTSTPRTGGSTIAFSTNVTLSAGPEGFSFYTTAMGPGDQRQPYFNNLQITSSPPPAGGNLTNTTIHVRLAGNGTVGAKTGNLTFASLNATTRSVELSGTVNPPPPVLSVSTPSLSPFTSSLNTPSAPASFSVNGSHLTVNVSVSAPAGFEVSTNNATGFSANLTLVPQSGTLASTTLFARLASQTSAAILTGNISITSGNASAAVGVSGEVFEVPPGPFIRLGNATTSIPLAILGEPSTPAGPVAVDGFALGSNLTINAPDGLEISSNSGGNFSSNLVFSPNGQGSVTSISLLIRTAATAPVGAFSSNVTLSSTGAETKTITVSGTVFAKPVLSPSTTSLSGFATRIGEGPSPSASFTLNATNLLGNVTLTAPGGFEIATSAQGTYSTSLTLPVGNGTLAATIHARLAASGTKSNPSGNLTISSPQADSRQVALTGIVRGPATIAVTPSSLSPFNATLGNASATQTVSVSGTDLYGDIDITVPPGFEISLDGINFSKSLRLTSNASSGEAAILAIDSASNYDGNWGNGTNSGWGFSPWEFEVFNNPPAFFAGAFVGNPADAGITGLPAPAFGLYANPDGSGAKAEVSRGIPPLEIGDSFSFQWATNWDSGAGNKGFSLFIGEQQVVNVNQGNFPGNITFNGQLAIDGGSGYGNQPMTWTLTRTSATNLLVTSTPRTGGSSISFSANLTIGGAPDGFVWYVDAMEPGDQRQPYYNNLRVVSGTRFGGDIPATTVHLRLAASNSDVQFSGDLLFLSPLAETRVVPISGRTVPPPELGASPAFLGGLATKVDDLAAPYKATGSFVVNGKGLVGNVTVTPSPGLEFSGDNSTFSANSVTLMPVDGDVQQTVYARIAASAAQGLFQGNATISSSAAENVVVSIAGSVLDDSVVFRNPGLASALGTQNDLNFDWTTTGSALWFVQTAESSDGVDALQSGVVGAGNSTSVQTNLVGPGRLTFHWKISALAPNGRLVLFLSGNEVARISGQVGWNERTILLPARETPHNVRFVYHQGTGSLGGSDAAWIDQVSFVPGDFAPQISIEYGGAPLAIPGGVVPFQVVGLEGSQTRTITIRNTGTAPLVLAGNPTVSGNGFSLSSNASQFTLAPRETVNVGVTSTVGSFPSWSGFLVVPSNDPDNPSLSIPLQGNVTLTALENWRGRKFLSPWNTGNAGNLADPDKDGISNLLEYAFGFDPWIANPVSPVVLGAQSRGGKRHLSLLLNRSADDLNYIVEASDNLTNWSPVKTYVGTMPDADDPHFVDTGHDLNAPAASRRFLRVKVLER
jgi:hypothetical protein